MKVTILLLISTQVFLATAGPSRGGKEPVLTSIACNDQAADSATDLSLRQLNANRREGFVLGLKRISNVQEQYDEENGSIFYLTLDVLETNCHVLSRRFWKDCEAKPRHEAVFGQCKVIFQLNKSKRIAHLHNYDCTLSPALHLWGLFTWQNVYAERHRNLRMDIMLKQSPIDFKGILLHCSNGRISLADVSGVEMQIQASAKRIAARLPFGCPGCHFSQPLNDTSFQEVAKKSLEKFNKESNYNKYFSLGNITKAAQQVVAGKAYHVEFTIVESTCNKSADDFSLCEALDCEFAHTGYCKSMAVAHWSSPDDKKVQKVTCDVFEPEAAVVEEQKHKEGHAGDQPSSDNKDHGKKGDRGGGKKHGHKHGHAKHGNKHSRKHNHKHDHNHDSGSHEHEHDHEHEHLHDYEHHHGQPQRPHGPPSDAPKTVGTITYLSGNVAPTTASPADAAKKGKGPKPDKKEQRKPSKSFIRPFPEKASTSDQCPGPVKNIPFTENVPAVEVTQEPTPLPK